MGCYKIIHNGGVKLYFYLKDQICKKKKKKKKKKNIGLIKNKIKCKMDT
jgi:hypothetical protein